jgi:hypothetical protein
MSNVYFGWLVGWLMERRASWVRGLTCGCECECDAARWSGEYACTWGTNGLEGKARHGIHHVGT